MKYTAIIPESKPKEIWKSFLMPIRLQGTIKDQFIPVFIATNGDIHGLDSMLEELRTNGGKEFLENYYKENYKK